MLLRREGPHLQRFEFDSTDPSISGLVATIALAASNLAPRRTVLTEALIIVVVLAGAASGIRRLTSS